VSAASPSRMDGTISPGFDPSRGSSPGLTESLPRRAKAWTTEKLRATETGKPTADAGGDELVDFEPLAITSRSRTAPVPDDKSRWAQATVLKVEPDYVTCEVSGLAKYWEISLPRSFFSNNVRYGTPVRIGTRDVNGYRTPVVEEEVTHSAHFPELDQLRAKLERL
jgi:hypothetical protein